MADEGIINYVRDNLSRGVSVEEIKNSLRTKGWDEIQISDALAQAGAPPETPADAPLDTQQPLAVSEDTNVPPEQDMGMMEEPKGKNNTMLLIAIVVLVILLIALLVVGLNIINTMNELFPGTGSVTSVFSV